MKVRLPNDLLIIDILVILLILSITFIPNTVARVILGLPFILFFPGYVLVAALFVRKAQGPSSSPPSTIEGEKAKPGGEMDGIERTALSFGMSIAVTGLIGLGLNYTPWGIRLEPVLYSISVFIIILSLVAILRRRSHGRKGLTARINLRIPGVWQGSPLNKTLSVILIIAILGAIGTLAYTVARPKTGEKFSEFYILGINGKAADYPTDFVLSQPSTLNPQPSVASVQYGSNTAPVSEKWGRITLGIVNHEQATTSYTVVMQIDGTQVNIPFQGGTVKSIGPVVLTPEEKWEQEIGIVPQHTGQNQEVLILLYKNGGTSPYLNLHLWINVTE